MKLNKNNKQELYVSRYTFFVEHDGRYFLYNTLSNALTEIDGELCGYLKEIKGKQVKLNKEMDDDIMKILLTNRFITENDEDEYLIYKSVIQSLRSELQTLILTIAPTMDCCFDCHYCFERTKSPIYMNEDVMHGIAKFVSSLENIKLVKITWFGGEPLMAVPQMEKLYRKLKRRSKGIPIRSNIITSGFHLNEPNIRALQRMKVSEMQITLDGMKESHNKIKFTAGCDDAFSKVLDNIDLATAIAPEIHIVIRTNLTKTNAHEYKELQNLIYDRYKGKNVAIAPAFVMDRDESGMADRANLFSHNEYPRYILGLSNSGIDSPQVRYPSRHITECAIRNPLSLSFGPDGAVYKCWEHIGNPEFVIGKIDKDGILSITDTTLLNRQMYGADPLEDNQCRECPYLPLCLGGCPIQRVQNKFYGAHNNHCTYYKGHIQEFIAEHVRKKEAGMQNLYI